MRNTGRANLNATFRISHDCVIDGPSCEAVDPHYKGLYEALRSQRSEVCGRFFNRVSVLGNRGCWVWLGAKGSQYGKFKFRNKTFQAHRVSFAICRSEPLIATLEIDHTCRNRSCVNPLHLDQVCQSENKKRAAFYRRKATSISQQFGPGMTGEATPSEGPTHSNGDTE